MVTVDKVYLRKRDTFSEGFTTMKSMTDLGKSSS